MQTPIWNLLTITIVIVGWFVIAKLNRRHEIEKERRKYRCDTVKSLLLLSYAIIENRTDNVKVQENVQELIPNVMLYFYPEEIKQYDNFAKALEAAKTDKKNMAIFSEELNKTISLVTNRVRKELRLPMIPPKT
ncbi:MAG TPA: hypothetical protein VMG59_06930 [Phycisphaerae bacterium]|nr:hypothetical protein [Phycisphaerae bacterium]